MLSFALLLASLAHAEVPPESEILPTRTEECRSFLQALPADYFHGWVESPEDIHDATSRKILVFYYGLKAPGFANPVSFHNGGPGSDNHRYKSFQRILDGRGARDKLSLIYVDQRGNGCSDSYPQGKDLDTVLRLRWYGSSGIVHDSEIVRRTLLGDRKWKVFGQSYGAFIVHRYVMLFPDSVAGAYAHANAISPSPLDRLAERIYSQHRVLGIYLKKFPDDKIRLEKLREFAEAKTCLKPKNSSESCGHSNFDAVTFDLGFTDYWDDMHENLVKAVPVNEIDLAGLTEIVEAASGPSPTSETAHSASVIAAFDRNVLSYDEENCKAAMAVIERRWGVRESEIVTSECHAAIQNHDKTAVRPEVEEMLGPSRDFMTWDKFRAGLERLGAGKFHLYSGANDTLVPMETVEPEARALGDLVTYVNFPGSGHDGYYSEPKVWDDLLE